MFKRTVTYNDFNGQQHTEDLYFHMMAPELTDLQFNPTLDGDMGEFLQKAMKSGDMHKVYAFFKLLIVHSYGRRSEDGARFTKNAEFTEEFMSSPAYEEFFMQLISDHEMAIKFVNEIIPEKLTAKIEEQLKTDENGPKKKLVEMSKEELLALMQDKINNKAS